VLRIKYSLSFIVDGHASLFSTSCDMYGEISVHFCTKKCISIITMYINKKKSRLFLLYLLLLKKICNILKIQWQSIAFGHRSLKIARKTLISQGNMRDKKLLRDARFKNERVPDLYFHRWKIEKHVRSCFAQKSYVSVASFRYILVYSIFETFYDLDLTCLTRTFHISNSVIVIALCTSFRAMDGWKRVI